MKMFNSFLSKMHPQAIVRETKDLSRERRQGRRGSFSSASASGQFCKPIDVQGYAVRSTQNEPEVSPARSTLNSSGGSFSGW